MRRPLGILTGTIDKLLITPSTNGDGFEVEIIDFKTNRFHASSKPRAQQSKTIAAVAVSPAATPRVEIGSQPAQGLFNFETVEEKVSIEPVADVLSSAPALSLAEQAESIARDYQLQMQSYALALHELVRTPTRRGSDRIKDSPLEAGPRINSLRATLHFIDPNIEVSLPASLLDQESCARAIDDAMLSIATLDGTLEAELFPPSPASHCRICNFLELCPAGRDWLNRER